MNGLVRRTILLCHRSTGLGRPFHSLKRVARRPQRPEAHVSPYRGGSKERSAQARRLSSSAGSAAQNGDDNSLPAFNELKKLFWISAVPMIGFGFTDNLVMILAGDAIDSTIGVRFGLSTLAAAGLGQCCSDTTGVLFGNTLDAAATRLGLPQPRLTPAQRAHPRSKAVQMVGACLGVVFGCLLGMSSLFLLDTKDTEKKKWFAHVEVAYERFLAEGRAAIGCERAVFLVVDESSGMFWSRYGEASQAKGKLLLFDLKKGVAGHTVRERKSEIIQDAYANPHFSPLADKHRGMKTDNMISCPIISEGGEVVAVLQLLNKAGGFTADDLRLAEMLARHMAICADVLE
uniref:GAF domain-containing protein n=1 Tax=Heterosigma akashiwo TaxID=2829 RepID=A0A6V1R239_HETAK|mmetsp:Transcript_17409/g.23892  ORF Transcript_17409/g.23892 Transcript_17409/m.23892 type:complete len:346 (-) Transcript_17409:36-1073(-)